jgi:hypothetical protein
MRTNTGLTPAVHGRTVGELRAAISLLADEVIVVLGGEAGFTLEMDRVELPFPQTCAFLDGPTPRPEAEILRDLEKVLGHA